MCDSTQLSQTQTARDPASGRPPSNSWGRRVMALSTVRMVTMVIGVAMLLGAGPLAADSPPASVLPRSASPDGAEVYFITPTSREELTSPVVVRFGLRNMGVAPAGTKKDATGHHHLVVDAELPRPDLPIPASDAYRHFGKGQTEVEIELSPGEHTLQLVLGDHNHIPHNPPVVSGRITITVE
jgi:hypothetical protein